VSSLDSSKADRIWEDREVSLFRRLRVACVSDAVTHEERRMKITAQTCPAKVPEFNNGIGDIFGGK
jgi:hypothetical protein